jgi:ABC-type nitrate/sulfonate/bicarbonate transport system substrate-binding protein
MRDRCYREGGPMRDRWRRVRVPALLLLAALALACAAPPPGASAPAALAPPASGSPQPVADPPTPTRLTVAYGALSANYTPIWVTKEQGFFERYGIDADLTYLDGAVGVQALAAGDAPISAVGAALIPMRLAGADVVQIADGASRLLYTLYAQPEVTSVEALRGRTIVTTTPGSSNYQGLQVFLGRYGMDLNRDVQLLLSQGGNEQIAMLRQGLADAAIFTPPASVRAREIGLHEVLALAEANIPFATAVISVNRPWSERNGETIRAFLRAYGEGLRVANADPAAAKDALARYTRLDDAAVLDEIYAFSSPAWPKGPPYPSVAAIQTVLDLQDSPAARTARAEDFVDTQYVRALDESGFYRQIGLQQ